MSKKPISLSREQEMEALKTRNEKIKQNPDYGFKLLQKAGIYDKDRQLTEPYRED